MHANVDPAAVLALWERGLGQPASARATALLDGAPQTLGERNVMLLAVHVRLFGRTLALRSPCARCGTAAEFAVDCEALLAQLPAARGPLRHMLEAEGHVVAFRLPGPADLVAVSDAAGDEFVLRLVESCVLDCRHGETPVPPRDLPEPLLDALSRRMEALDAAATLAFAVECPQCATRWQASFDAGLALWQKVQAAAERVLLEIDALARAYGWTESEVLKLSPLRRAAYLQLAA